MSERGTSVSERFPVGSSRIEYQKAVGWHCLICPKWIPGGTWHEHPPPDHPHYSAYTGDRG